MSDVNQGRDRDETGQRVVPAEEVSQIVEQRVNELNESHREEVKALREEIEGLKKSNDPPKQTYTWTQLEKAVEDKTITAAEANAIWAKQEREENQRLIHETVQAAVTGMTQNDKIQSQIDKYKAAFPDITKPGSEARAKVQQAIKQQLGFTGLEKPTLGTELAALSMLFGPPESLGNTDQHPRQTHQETEGRDDDVSAPSNGSLKGATAAQRAYYMDKINKGIYTFEQAQKELDSKHNRHRGKV